MRYKNRTNIVKIGDKEIYMGCKPFIIAEIGANHNGDVELAKQMIEEAKRAGADCAKFQLWSKEKLFSEVVYDGNKELEKQLDNYSLNYDQMRELKEYCDDVGIMFGCTPCTNEDVDFLVDELDVAFIKIGSTDLNNFPLLEHAASKDKPIVLSTGLSTIQDINNALRCIYKTNHKIILMYCVALYPPKPNQITLAAIDMFKENYNFPIGFSDHYIDETFSLAAVAKGAAVIERHFTIDKKLDSWDSKISSDPKGMKKLVDTAKLINEGLGKYYRDLSNEEFEKRESFRRSIVAKSDLRCNHKIIINDLAIKRPGTGIPPTEIEKIIGKRTKRAINKDELIKYEDLE